MPHGGIIGMTESGKTHLGKKLASDFRKSGVGVLVLHKPHEPWPAANWQTDNPDLFIEKVWKCRSCAVFMEMADASVEKNDTRFHRLFQQGRHWGHRLFYLTQRGQTVHPAIRENCQSLYLFAVGDDAAKVWATEFRDPLLLKAATLPPHQFFFKANRYTPAQFLTLKS